ncbi:hypothetical protein LX16_4349 [Stackebrandtia albiflava]|uniref:Uncharacterized protein n=1 Tax=Stackebrandtia albiflava TaxID=406432 RepID=A0A562UR84_9ACTN|nr:hypothetical protein [Stackebrandtia albiflava]TWJ08129.1 hypothetical protein LX16_4349 [Stackebrandtia albiflava]
MPRNRPRALRVTPERPPRSLRRIRGLSGRTASAIAQWEATTGLLGTSPGMTTLAWESYRAFTSRSGTTVRYPRPETCGAPTCALDDVRHARDLLEQALVRLPRPAGAELRRLLAPLDDAYLRITLPDPFARHGPYRNRAWWWHRLTQPY